MVASEGMPVERKLIQDYKDKLNDKDRDFELTRDRKENEKNMKKKLLKENKNLN